MCICTPSIRTPQCPKCPVGGKSEAAYVTRMRTELKELKSKRNGLKYYLPKATDLSPEKRNLMERQRVVMDEYINLLTSRLELE